MDALGADFAEHFKDAGITKVFTIESSGIAPALMTAEHLHVPLVILKKQTSKILNGNVYQTRITSFTKGTSYELTLFADYITPEDRILLIDDFLANERRHGCQPHHRGVRSDAGRYRHPHREVLPERKKTSGRSRVYGVFTGENRKAGRRCDRVSSGGRAGKPRRGTGRLSRSPASRRLNKICDVSERTMWQSVPLSLIFCAVSCMARSAVMSRQSA